MESDKNVLLLGSSYMVLFKSMRNACTLHALENNTNALTIQYFCMARLDYVFQLEYRHY